MFCAWCFVLLLFRTVLNEQYDWRAEWKPRGVRSHADFHIELKIENLQI